jgi:hypothetical protein
MKPIIFITDDITGSIYIYIIFVYYFMKVAETEANFSSMRKAKVFEVFLIPVTLRGSGINFTL